MEYFDRQSFKSFQKRLLEKKTVSATCYLQIIIINCKSNNLNNNFYENNKASLKQSELVVLVLVLYLTLFQQIKNKNSL